MSYRLTHANLKKIVELMAEASSLRSEKRLETALARIEQAEEIDPNFFPVLTDKAHVLNKMGRFEEAVRCFDRLLGFLPNLTEARLQRDKILDDALAQYDGMLEANPEDANILFKRGNILQHMRRHEDAVRSYWKALEREPRNQHLWNNLGNSLLELNRHEDSLACYNRVLEISPNNEVALFNRGNILQQLGLMDDAIESYRRALSCKPIFPEATMEQSLCRLAMGQYDEGWRTVRSQMANPPDEGQETPF